MKYAQIKKIKPKKGIASMTNRTRRILALIVIVTLFSRLEILIKALIIIPTLQLLMINYDEFNKLINENERGCEV